MKRRISARCFTLQCSCCVANEFVYTSAHVNELESDEEKISA